MENKFLVLLAYFVVCFFWGLSWLAIQLSLPSFPPFFNASFRFIIASIVIFILAKLFSFKIILDKKSKTIYLLMALFTFALPFSLVYWAEEHIPSSLASILFGMYPFMVALFSYLFISKDDLDFLKVLGIILAFIGLTIIFSEGLKIKLDEYFLGMLAVFMSASIQALMAVYLKKNASYLNPMTMNFFPTLIAAIILLIFGLIFEGVDAIKFTWFGFSMIMFLAIFATVLTFSAYYWLLKRVNVVILSLTSFITPIVAIFFGWLLNNEKLSSNTFLGSALILVGILVVNNKIFNIKKN